MGSNEEKKEKKFIPGIILDEDGEEVLYELTGGGCSRCPLRGLCG